MFDSQGGRVIVSKKRKKREREREREGESTWGFHAVLLSRVIYILPFP